MEMLKQAAEQLKALKNEVEEYRTYQEIEKQAGLIIGKMIENEQFDSPLEVLEKLSELKEKDLDELKVIEKAIELNKSQSHNLNKTAHKKVAGNDLGRLSDAPSGDGMDNLTSFLLKDY